MAPNKTWPHNFMVNLRFFPQQQSWYLFLTTTTISQKLMFHLLILILPRMPILMNILQMRLSATKALIESNDTIVVASVSAIYGLGDPKSYLRL